MKKIDHVQQLDPLQEFLQGLSVSDGRNAVKIINQFPLSEKPSAGELLKLLSQASGQDIHNIQKIGYFKNIQFMVCHEISQSMFCNMLVIIDTRRRRTVIKSIPIFAKYTKQTQEEVMKALDISKEKLETQIMKTTQEIMVMMEDTYQKYSDLEKEIARECFEKKYSGIRIERLTPHLSKQEKKEYLHYREEKSYNDIKTKEDNGKEDNGKEDKKSYSIQRKYTEKCITRYEKIRKRFIKTLKPLTSYYDKGYTIFDNSEVDRDIIDKIKYSQKEIIDGIDGLLVKILIAKEKLHKTITEGKQIIE